MALSPSDAAAVSWVAPTTALALIGLGSQPEQRAGFYEHLTNEKSPKSDSPTGGISFVEGKSKSVRLIDVHWPASANIVETAAETLHTQTLAASAVSQIIALPVAPHDPLWASPLSVFAWSAQDLLQRFGIAKTVLLVLPQHTQENATAAAHSTMDTVSSLLRTSCPDEPMLYFQTVCLNVHHPTCRAAAAALIEELLRRAEPLDASSCAVDVALTCSPPPPAAALAVRHHSLVRMEQLLLDTHAKMNELRQLADFPGMSSDLPRSVAGLWDDATGAFDKDSSLAAPELVDDIGEQLRVRLSQEIHTLLTDLMAGAVETFYYRFRNEAENISTDSHGIAPLRRLASQILLEFVTSFQEAGTSLPAGSLDRYQRLLQRLIEKEISSHRSRQGLVLQRKLAAFLGDQLDEQLLPLLEAMPASDLAAAWRDIRVAFALVMAATDRLLEQFSQEYGASEDELSLLQSIVQREVKQWLDARLRCIVAAVPSYLYSRFEDAFWQLASTRTALMSAFTSARTHALQLLEVFDRNAAFELDSTYQNPRIAEARREEFVVQLDARITRDFRLATTMTTQSFPWAWLIVALLVSILLCHEFVPSPIFSSLPSLVCGALFLLTVVAAAQSGVLNTLDHDVCRCRVWLQNWFKGKTRK